MTWKQCTMDTDINSKSSLTERLMNSKVFFILSLAFCMVELATAQKLVSTDYYTGIKNHNLSPLWYTLSESSKADVMDITVPEPLGFIGEEFQRFYIHYTSISKSKTNPYEYLVVGKTKVKENICNFTGTITIVKSGIYKEQSDPRYRQGFVECRVDFYEDSSRPFTGFIKGKLTTKFYLDEKRVIQYNDLLFGADLFYNNQCEASWTSYASHKSKRANWGDYRIPASRELDIGDGEFIVAKSYVKNGWINYATAVSGDPDNKATEIARQKELDHWWK